MPRSLLAAIVLLAVSLTARANEQPERGCLSLCDNGRVFASNVESGAELRVEGYLRVYDWAYETVETTIDGQTYWYRHPVQSTTYTDNQVVWSYTPTFTTDGECIQVTDGAVALRDTVSGAVEAVWVCNDAEWLVVGVPNDRFAGSMTSMGQFHCEPYPSGDYIDSTLRWEGLESFTGNVTLYLDHVVQNFMTGCSPRNDTVIRAELVITRNDFADVGGCADCTAGDPDQPGPGQPPDPDPSPNRPPKPQAPDPEYPDVPDPRTPPDGTPVPSFDPEQCPECPLLEVIIGQLDDVNEELDWLGFIYDSGEDRRYLLELIYGETYATAELSRDVVGELRDIEALLRPESTQGDQFDTVSADPQALQGAAPTLPSLPTLDDLRDRDVFIVDLDLTSLQSVFPSAPSSFNATVDLSWYAPFKPIVWALALFMAGLWAVSMLWEELRRYG